MEQHSKIHPDKSRGQIFLTDKNVLQKIIDAGELKSSDKVLEIGAGTGVLTAELAKRVKKVISFEIDKKLISVLQENLKDFNNVEIRNEDVLVCHSREACPRAASGSRNLEGVCDWIPSAPSANWRRRIAGMTGRGFQKYKLIANIPYNITSAILEKFLSAEQSPELIVLLVQREVAERVCAKPGDMSILSVMAQYYGEPKIVARVPPSAFWPAPKVASAILKIVINKRWPATNEKKFWQLVRAGFSQRRKMLKNNLRSLADEKTIAAAMREAGIAEKARAQELTVEQWVRLVRLWTSALDKTQ